jgi:hypothetical protein
MVVWELPPERTGRKAAGVTATVTGTAAAGAWAYAVPAAESAQESPATAVKVVQRQLLNVIRGRAKWFMSPLLLGDRRLVPIHVKVHPADFRRKEINPQVPSIGNPLMSGQ